MRGGNGDQQKMSVAALGQFSASCHKRGYLAKEATGSEAYCRSPVSSTVPDSRATSTALACPLQNELKQTCHVQPKSMFLLEIDNYGIYKYLFHMPFTFYDNIWGHTITIY